MHQAPSLLGLYLPVGCCGRRPESGQLAHPAVQQLRWLLVVEVDGWQLYQLITGCHVLFHCTGLQSVAYVPSLSGPLCKLFFQTSTPLCSEMWAVLSCSAAVDEGYWGIVCGEWQLYQPPLVSTRPVCLPIIAYLGPVVSQTNKQPCLHITLCA